MSGVDKFGRTGKKGGELGRVGPRGPKGESIPIDKEGNYTMQNKRIKFLHNPEEKQDAVNKEWVEKHFLPVSKDRVSVGNKRLTDLQSPTGASDAVTKAYVDGKVLKMSDENSYDFCARMLRNVGSPMSDSDAVTKKWTEDRLEALKRDSASVNESLVKAAHESLETKIQNCEREVTHLKSLLTTSVLASAKVSTKKV